MKPLIYLPKLTLFWRSVAVIFIIMPEEFNYLHRKSPVLKKNIGGEEMTVLYIIIVILAFVAGYKLGQFYMSVEVQELKNTIENTTEENKNGR